MKKLLYITVAFIIAMIFIPNVFAEDEVSIKSYELVYNTETTIEVSKPKVDGLNISFDLSFSKVNDYARYKLVISNPTNKDYELSKDLEFSTSDYISYTFEYDDGDSIILANKEKIMYITITYEKVVPAEALVDGKFIETNKMSIGLSYASSTSMTEKDEKNPNTSIGIIALVVIAATISIICIVVLTKTTKKRYIAPILIISLVLLPIGIHALEKLQINIDTKITIEEKYQVSYTYYTMLKESEKSNYLYTTDLYNNLDSSCIDTYYMVEGEKYLYCEVYTKSYHSVGEKVAIAPIKYIYIQTHKYGSGASVMPICEYDSELDYYTCPKEALHEDSYYKNEFVYAKANNYEYQENDPEVLNITDYVDWWDARGYISFEVPNEFTMPSHNVIINEAVQGK